MLAPFEIHQPHSIKEASDLLTNYGSDAEIYAGGTELLVVMKERITHYPHLIDIKTIPGLDVIAMRGDSLTIGSLATHRQIERNPLVRQHFPVLAEMAANVANVRVRSAGSIGGNLCFAEPHSDPATLLIALNATLTLESATTSRELLLESFFTGLLETSRTHDELLTAITIPLLSSTTNVAYGRFKIHERPTATVAALIAWDDQRIKAARIVVGSVGPVPARSHAAEAELIGQEASTELFIAAGEAAATEIEPTEDPFESGDYKRHLVGVLTKRALETTLTPHPRLPILGEGELGATRSPFPNVGGGDPLGAAGGVEGRFTATVNGRPVLLEIEPREMLLDLLRDQLDLTGAKRSCDLQVCGACTVLVDGRPVSSCCTLAYEANGRSIETIEGLAAYGELHPIQSAFIEGAALQCGFCTSGMILATKALLAENPVPDRDDVKHALAGNLCRCTGYWNIVDAVQDAGRRLAGNEVAR